jgi:esterase/lipase superfamily enzyme
MLSRRLKIGVAIVLVALTVLAGWFYYFYFVGPDAAIQRAEAFAFRRMTVAQLAGQGSYRFHYVTNRAAEDHDATLDERYGPDRGDALKFGYFDTKIEPTLGIGMLIDPTAWFQNEEIQISGISSVDRPDFVVRVREQVEKSPNRSLLVVVHGYRERFPSALRKTAFLSHVLDINSPVVVFDWPGDQGSSLRGYRRARSVAEASGAELAEALQLIVNEIQPDRVWLIANSMGGQVVADAFGILYTDEAFADLETEIEDVVLTAPDIDHEEFDEQFRHEIAALATRLTVYVSSNDRALLISRVVNRGRRAGESTVSPDQLEEASRFLEMVDPGESAVTLVDVTPVNRTRNFHNFSLETPEFFDDLFLRLTNPVTPRSRMMYQVQTADGRVYWVLTRGR